MRKLRDKLNSALDNAGTSVQKAELGNFNAISAIDTLLKSGSNQQILRELFANDEDFDK